MRNSVRSSISDMPQLMAVFDQDGNRIEINPRRSSIFETFDFEGIENFGQLELQLDPSVRDSISSVRRSVRNSMFIVNRVSKKQQERVQSTVVKDNRNSDPPSQQISIQSIVDNRTSNQSIQIFPMKNSMQQQKSQKTIPILLILTDAKEITQVQLIDSNLQVHKLVSSFYQFNQKYLSISVFHIPRHTISQCRVKYQTETTTLLVFSRTQDREVSLKDVIVHQEVGVFCKQILENSNPLMINYCIFQGHQYLIKRIQNLKKNNNRVLHQFYQIFKMKYKKQCPNQQKIFKCLRMDDTNCKLAEYFLYFIYVLYCQNSQKFVLDNDLMSRFKFNSQSIPFILKYKRYDEFQNGKCFKDFVLYTIMLFAMRCFKEHYKSLRVIAKYCIIELDKFKVKNIFNMLQDNPVMNYLLQNDFINIKLITNSEITFVEYFAVLFKYIEASIKSLKQQEDNCPLITDQFVKMLQKINAKAESNTFKGVKEVFIKYFQPLNSLLRDGDDSIVIDNSRLGEVYLQIKLMLKLVPPLGQLFLVILKKDIMQNVPILLKHFFPTVIYPLVLLPEIIQENALLNSHFFKQRIPTFNIMYLINIVLQKRNTLYNYHTYVISNPHFQEFSLSKLKKILEEALQEQKITEDNKQLLFQLCSEIVKKQRHEEKEYFVQWWKREEKRFK